MALNGSWWIWYQEQEFPLDSTFRQRTVDLWQRYKVRRDEQRPWDLALTLPDLGELTAQWAEGTVKYHPGGYDDGPAEETEEIAPALAILNRNGFVTSGSQPGEAAEMGYDGNLWWQRAAVDGFAHDDRVLAALNGDPLSCWVRKTNRLIRSERREIEALAETLYEHGRLDGDDARAILSGRY